MRIFIKVDEVFLIICVISLLLITLPNLIWSLLPFTWLQQCFVSSDWSVIKIHSIFWRHAEKLLLFCFLFGMKNVEEWGRVQFLCLSLHWYFILNLLFFSVIFTPYYSFSMYISFSFSFLFPLFLFCLFLFLSFFHCHFLFLSYNFLLFSVISFSHTVTLLTCGTVLRCECDLGKLQSQVRMKVLSSCTDAPDVLGVTCWVTFTITSCSLIGVDETLTHPCLSSLIPNFCYQVPSVPVGDRNYIDLSNTLKTWRPWTDGPERHVIIFISFSSWIFELWLCHSWRELSKSLWVLESILSL